MSFGKNSWFLLCLLLTALPAHDVSHQLNSLIRPEPHVLQIKSESQLAGTQAEKLR